MPVGKSDFRTPLYDYVREWYEQKKHIVVPCPDDDLFRRTVDPPRLVKIGGDDSSQSIFPLRISHPEQLGLVLPQHIFRELSPHLIRETLQIYPVRRKVIQDIFFLLLLSSGNCLFRF